MSKTLEKLVLEMLQLRYEVNKQGYADNKQFLKGTAILNEIATKVNFKPRD